MSVQFRSLSEGDFYDMMAQAVKLIDDIYVRNPNAGSRVHDYSFDLNLIELYVQSFIINHMSNGNPQEAVISCMTGVQAAFLLGYEQGAQDKNIEGSIPSAIRNLKLEDLDANG